MNELAQLLEWELDSVSLYVDKKIIDQVGLKPATILSVFQTNDIKLDYSQISERIPFLSEKIIKSCLKKLLKSKYLSAVQLSEPEIIEILMAKRSSLDGRGIGNFHCPYCQGFCLLNHVHHLSDSTIPICPNCHYEFHHLQKLIYYHKGVKIG